MIDFERMLQEITRRIGDLTEDARRLQTRVQQPMDSFLFPEGRLLTSLAHTGKRLALYRHTERLLRNAQAGDYTAGTTVADVLRSAAAEALKGALALHRDSGNAFDRARDEAQRSGCADMYRSLLRDAEFAQGS